MTRGWLAAAGLLAAGPVAAQTSTRVAGQVLRVAESDTTAVAGARIVLHHVGPATQGPIDSVRTDGRGRFALRFSVDTTASYLLSTRHAGIEYFSLPVATRPERADTAVRLLVFDTSSVTPTRTRSRTLVVSAPDAAGARTIVDWFTIGNDGYRTRVAGDTSEGTWSAALPGGIRNVGQGDARFSEISPEAVRFRSDSVIITAPIAPGEKSLLLQYELPQGERRLAVSVAGQDSVDVFVEERAVRSATGWAPQDSQPFQGRVFHRLRRADAGVDDLDLRFPGSGIVEGPALALLVIGLAGGLGAAVWLARRRRPAAVAADPAVSLAERIARLDQELGRLRAGGAAEQVRALERERGELLARLREALAARSRRS